MTQTHCWGGGPSGVHTCVPGWARGPGCSRRFLSPSSPGPGSGWKLERVVELEHVLRQLLPGPAAAHAGVQRAFVRGRRVPGPLGGDPRLLPAAVPRSGRRVPVGGARPVGAVWGLSQWPWGRGGRGLCVVMRGLCRPGGCLFLHQVELWFLPSWSQRLLSSRLPGPASLRPRVSASPRLLDLHLLVPAPAPPCLAVSRSGWEVASLGVVGRLQCHLRGRHAAPGSGLLGALLRGSGLPGPAG